jgi:hypothetical protein
MNILESFSNSSNLVVKSLSLEVRVIRKFLLFCCLYD